MFLIPFIHGINLADEMKKMKGNETHREHWIDPKRPCSWSRSIVHLSSPSLAFQLKRGVENEEFDAQSAE